MSKRQARVVQTGEAVMYLGPSVKDGLLKHSAMYSGGVLPEYLQKLSDENKDIKALIVPVSKIAETKNNLRNKSSLDYARFARILETYTKGAK